MSLFDVGNLVAHQTSHVPSGKTAVSMGLELHGYLQTALESCGLDSVIMPQAQSNGFEVMRLLNEGLKPHTALGALSDLREIVVGTNLFNGENFGQRLLDWEHKLAKLTDRYAMQIPDLLKYLIVMNHAPLELQSHVCLTYSHTTPFCQIREVILNYMQASVPSDTVRGAHHPWKSMPSRKANLRVKARASSRGHQRGICPHQLPTCSTVTSMEHPLG